MTAPRVAFLVVRSSLTVGQWSARPSIWEDNHYQGLEDADNGPVRVPEAVFFDCAAAERERTRRELLAREFLNPFWLGQLRELSSRDASDVHARLRELESFPMPLSHAEVDDWAKWWDRASANWTDEQRAAVWKLFNQVRLFEVIEVELE